MNTAIEPADRFTVLPDDATLSEAIAAAGQRGFSVELVDDLDAARDKVLARIPEGASAMAFPSLTLETAGIAQAIDENGRYDSARLRGYSLDRGTQMHEIKALMLQPAFALGSVQAIT